MKILLVEDDQHLSAALAKLLNAEQYVVDMVQDGEAAWTYCLTFDYDLLILDVVLPKLNGIELCRRIRAEGQTLPILLLTSRDQPTAKVKGLDAGADDYVVKPYDPQELLARVRALLRRQHQCILPIMTWGDLVLTPSTGKVTYANQELKLTTKEYGLLELLMQDGHHLLSSEDILDSLWASEEFPAEATVRSHVRRLRNKLKAAGAPTDIISTIHGRGYYLKPLDSIKQLGQEQASLDAASNPTRAATQSVAEPLRPEEQYVQFLAQTWPATQSKLLSDLAAVAEMLSADEPIPLSAKQQAVYIAHKLAGTLGVFGIPQGTALARQLEEELKVSQVPPPAKTAQLQVLVIELRQLIQNTHTVTSYWQEREEQQAKLWIVDANVAFTSQLAGLASQRGFQTAIASTLDEVLQTPLSSLQKENSPTVLLYRHPVNSGVLRTDSKALQQLQAIAQACPSMSIIILGQSDLGDRLLASQQQWTFWAETTISDEVLITTISRLIANMSNAAKVLVIDDDLEWLDLLPNLLKPWPIQLTTLNNPDQIWDTLQSVQPDALVLDITMPKVNGFELCQMLRNDPVWGCLPIIFLSVLEDSQSQDYAFQIGADDYIYKSLATKTLAHRILNRVARTRSRIFNLCGTPSWQPT